MTNTFKIIVLWPFPVAVAYLQKRHQMMIFALGMRCRQVLIQEFVQFARGGIRRL